MRNANRKVADAGRLLCRSFVFACLASLLLGSQVRATPLIVYAQNGASNTATLTNNGDGTETITSSTDVTVTNIAGQGNLNVLAHIVLSASSIAGTTTGPDVNNNISERFTGTFSIISGTDNLLSGSFTDLFSGKNGGTQATLGVANPPDSLSFTSDEPAVQALFGLPLAMSIAFTNLSQPLTIVNGSIGALGATTMTQAGNFSGNPIGVPEPSSFLAAAIGGLGLIGYGLRRRRAPGI